MKHACVFGLGKSGISAVRYLVKKGYRITATDDSWDKIALPDDAKHAATLMSPRSVEERLDNERYDLAIISPGIPPTHSLIVRLRALGVETIGDTELGCREALAADLPMVGITGTNGKTTTTLLVEHMLRQAGKNALAVGNVGTPFLDEIDQAKIDRSILVAELSSFQLETMSARAFSATVILNITPDHLDRYESMQAYAEAKLRIANCTKSGGKAYLHESVRSFVPKTAWKDFFFYGFSPDCYLYTDGRDIWRGGLREGSLPSSLVNVKNHDTENFLAAYGLARELGLDAALACDSYLSFKKPAHRIEYVATIDGISFWDDSKGTNIDAVIRAVDAMPGKVRLIAGGVHKGEPYSSWITPFLQKVDKIVAIGQAAPMIEKDLSAFIPVERSHSLEEAVHKAMSGATAGDSVLLSPGCSSFDMFKDYKERGEKFQEIVKKL